MELTEFETRAQRLVRDGALGYDQKFRRLAPMTTEVLPYPHVSEALVSVRPAWEDGSWLLRRHR